MVTACGESTWTRCRRRSPSRRPAWSCSCSSTTSWWRSQGCTRPSPARCSACRRTRSARRTRCCAVPVRSRISGRRAPATRPRAPRNLVKEHLRKFPGAALWPPPRREKPPGSPSSAVSASRGMRLLDPVLRPAARKLALRPHQAAGARALRPAGRTIPGDQDPDEPVSSRHRRVACRRVGVVMVSGSLRPGRGLGVRPWRPMCPPRGGVRGRGGRGRVRRLPRGRRSSRW